MVQVTDLPRLFVVWFTGEIFPYTNIISYELRDRVATFSTAWGIDVSACKKVSRLYRKSV